MTKLCGPEAKTYLFKIDDVIKLKRKKLKEQINAS